jgi:acetoacetyl-CoA synthetase
VVASLATASLGAIWASCAPEFGARSVIDRFAQVEPRVLLTVSGYRYGAKDVDRRAEVAEIRSGPPKSSPRIAGSPTSRSSRSRTRSGR